MNRAEVAFSVGRKGWRLSLTPRTKENSTGFRFHFMENKKDFVFNFGRAWDITGAPKSVSIASFSSIGIRYRHYLVGSLLNLFNLFTAHFNG